MPVVKKLYEYFGVEKQPITKSCDRSCSACGGYKDNQGNSIIGVEVCEGHIFVYPAFTISKAWQLEEIINEWINNKGTWLYLVVFESAYAIHESNLESPAEEIFVSIGDTRLEALASLIPKIDWTDEERKTIKNILEN